MPAVVQTLKIFATVICGPLLLLGCVWILQAIDVLPGSVMSGHLQWALYGSVLAILGSTLVFWVNKPAT